MITIEQFTQELARSMEQQSSALKGGELFLPQYLPGQVFTMTFPVVMETLAQRLNMGLKKEFRNKFDRLPDEYEANSFQNVDYALLGEDGQPQIFVELDSLNCAQLMRFSDGQVSENVEKDNWNKLWYYWFTLGKHYSLGKPVPQYFLFLLILPDREVEPYQLWDIQKPYQLFHPDLARTVYENPYKFYDRQIKAAARGLIRNDISQFLVNGKWKKKEPREFMRQCELVFITCTIDRLILSRGRDMFDPAKERLYHIRWARQANGSWTSRGQSGRGRRQRATL
jgi:hypothetical protein